MTSELKYFEKHLAYLKDRTMLLNNLRLDCIQRIIECEKKIQEVKQHNEEELTNDN